MKRKLVYDRQPVESVRHIDDNGYLHVDVSNITREQVAPYKGIEIPDFEKLGFEADALYYGYRPASELSKPETVNSLNGIPILLNHKPDSASEPASNRVGSTGTDAEWDAPFLKNSLHIQDADAISRINDGSMKELSMGYFYTPVQKSGEWQGQHYDFIMTDIACNHVALVEKGRAGSSVVVEDSALSITDLPAKKDGKEDHLLPSHKQETGMTREEQIKDLLKVTSVAGLDPEKIKEKIQLILEAKEDEGTTDGDTTEPEKKGEEGKTEGEKKAEDGCGKDEDPEKKDDDKVTLDEESEKAAKACGLDTEDPLIQKAFAEGVKYGERMEKEEPKKLDSEHESEGEKRALGEDTAEKITKMIEEQYKAKYSAFEAKHDAIEECEKSLGKVRASAYDSAEAVYLDALKAEGINTKDFKKSEARTAYRTLMSVKKKTSNTVTMDSAENQKDDALVSMLNNIKVGE